MNPPEDTDNVQVIDQAKRRQNTWKLVVLALVILAVAGLFLWKNLGGNANDAKSSGSDFQSSEFDLDATIDFKLDEILSHNLPVMIDFGSDSCKPCQAMAPILAELNQELRGKAIVKFVDVGKNAAAAQEIPLELIPTQFFFNADGTPFVPADEEAALADGFILYSRRDTGEHVFTAHQGGLEKDEILAVLKEMGMK